MTGSADGANGGTTAGVVYAAVRARLRAAGLATADLDARLLVARALGMEPGRLVLDADAAADPDRAFIADALATRRLSGEPVGRILGVREFWSMPFRLGPDVLEPRPDTETIVEAALATIADRDAPLTIADLGTGSGAILVALLSELPNATGIGVDLAPGAVAIARDNAHLNGVGDRALFLCGDFGAPLAGHLDLVVSNPPYIRSAVMPTLDPEVRLHDPWLALDGGPDGIGPYRVIFADAHRLVAPGGALVVEIGADAAAEVSDAAHAAGLDVGPPRHDLGGRPRALTVRRGA